MDDEKAREPVYYLESPSLPGMCISIEFPLLNNKRHRALFLFICSNMCEVYSQLKII